MSDICELEEVRPGLWACPEHEETFARGPGECPVCVARQEESDD